MRQLLFFFCSFCLHQHDSMIISFCARIFSVYDAKTWPRLNTAYHSTQQKINKLFYEQTTLWSLSAAYAIMLSVQSCQDAWKDNVFMVKATNSCKKV